MNPALDVTELTIERLDGAVIVDSVSLSLRPGELLGLVGESGCGKTTLSLGLLGHTRTGLRFRGGSVRLGDGVELVGSSDRDLRRVRGRRIAYVAQDPSAALNPSLRVEDQIAEIQVVHGLHRGDDTPRLLEIVGLRSDRAFRRRFPHQLSGGQQQRLAIAVALACQPEVVVLDEPTTALDVVTQGQLLAKISQLKEELNLAVVYVSHDIAVVASVADRIAVMYAGRIVELGRTSDVLRRPRHPYSLGLIASIPDHESPRVLKGIPGVSIAAFEAPEGCAFAGRCAQRTHQCVESPIPLEPVRESHLVRCLHWRATSPPAALPLRMLGVEAPLGVSVLTVRNLYASHGAGAVPAACGVSFELAMGECLALVGESGSGKTTIARCITGLHVPDRGEILLSGQPLAARAKERSKLERRQLQIVFQNPYDSLNPRRTVEESIERPIRLFEMGRSSEISSEVKRLLELVRLPSRLATRFPHELSGGERQRVAIARALAANPAVIVCDEITSALDVSVQAVVLDVLSELRRTLGLALVLITHDLGVVASVADRVVVLEAGTVREQGTITTILRFPTDSYTQRLLEAAPTIAPWLAFDEARSVRSAVRGVPS